MTPADNAQMKPVSLEDCLQQGQPNNLDFLRIVAAFLVLFGHSFTLLWSSPQYLFPHDPISAKLVLKLPFQEGLPGIGLHIFFFISGLLVTRSYINHNGKFLRFVSARLLRIIPAYIACILILSFIAGPFLSKLEARDYFKSAELWAYLKLNLTFTGLSTLPGVFIDNPFGRFVNGSLWTIPYELQLYGWVLLLGFLTLLKRRGIFLLIFFYLLLIYCSAGKSQIFLNSEVARLWIFFFFGILACLYADKITISPIYLFIAIPIILTWKSGNPWFDIIGAALCCYIIIVFSFYKYLSRLDVGKFGDYSYGIYLYAFPVQQTLIYFFKNELNGWLLVLCSTAIVLVLAMLSWHLIEAPALRLKGTRKVSA